MPLPGGDAIGLRAVDYHVEGLRAMGAAGGKACLKKGSDVGNRNRAVANPPLRRLDLNQWLQEQHAA